MAEGGAAAMDLDGLDGVRMTWNAWPRTKVEASKCVVPIAACVAPIRARPGLVELAYAPLRCKPPCGAVLNPFCCVDFAAKIWICPFCFSRNHFPSSYASISESCMPGELYPQCTTVEYAPLDPNSPHAPRPVFLFVLDTCLLDEELQFVKSAVRRALGLIPENALVGLVTFGTQVHLHELGFSDIPRVYVFQGTKDISADSILEQLGLSRGGAHRAGPKGMHPQANGVHPAGSVNRFLLPASECEYTLSTLLEELQTDQWPVKAGSRPLRCTGVALSIAAGLLGACVPGTGARIIALLGGPCTEGPGMVKIFVFV